MGGGKEPERDNSGGVWGPGAGFFRLVTHCILNKSFLNAAPTHSPPHPKCPWEGCLVLKGTSMPLFKRISHTQKNLLASMYLLNEATPNTVPSGPASS